jgi:hypothetical protein
MQQIMCAGTLIKKSTCRNVTTDEFVNMQEFLSSVHTDVHPLRRMLSVYTCVYMYVYIYIYIYIYIYTHTHTHTHIHIYIIGSTPIPSSVEVRLGSKTPRANPQIIEQPHPK